MVCHANRQRYNGVFLQLLQCTVYGRTLFVLFCFENWVGLIRIMTAIAALLTSAECTATCWVVSMSSYYQTVILILYLKCRVVKQTDTIPQRVCFAPSQAYIPQDLRCYLPQWFLHAALVDSYDNERRLLDMFPDKYQHTFVKPTAGSPLAIKYCSRSAVVRQIQQRVPAAIFATMLDWDLVKAIEDEAVWKNVCFRRDMKSVRAYPAMCGRFKG